MFEILKYTIKNKVYWNGIFFLGFIIITVAIILTYFSNDVRNLCAGIIFTMLLIICDIINGYNKIKYIPERVTPIELLRRKHKRLLSKHFEISILNINEDERKRITNELTEYQKAIKLLEENKNE